MRCAKTVVLLVLISFLSTQLTGCIAGGIARGLGRGVLGAGRLIGRGALGLGRLAVGGARRVFGYPAAGGGALQGFAFGNGAAAQPAFAMPAAAGTGNLLGTPASPQAARNQVFNRTLGDVPGQTVVARAPTRDELF